VQPDLGSHFIDQNGAGMSEFPFLPLFAAADAIHDNINKAPVDWPSVDVITDRNGLRKLLHRLNPSEGREVRDFPIEVELVGAKTIVVSCWEGRTREPPTGKIYGFAFEAATACAAPGCPSSGHHQTITHMRYHCMYCDFEVNACPPTETSTATAMRSGTSDTKCHGRESPELALDKLAVSLWNLGFHECL